MSTGKCVLEYEFDGHSTPGGYYEILVKQRTRRGVQTVKTIYTLTMKEAYEQMADAGYKIVEENSL